MILYRSKQKMANYKRLYSAVKAAEKIMNQWSDDEGNEADVVVLPPEKVDFLTGDEDINKDQVDRQGLPNDVCGNIQIQTNQPDADSANDDVDSVKESSWSSKTDQPSTNFPDVSSDADQKEKKVIALLEKIENEKSKATTWKSTLPIKTQLLEAVNSELKTVKDSKNAIMEKLSKNEAFEKYVNAEVKEMIVTETNRYWDIQCCTDSNGIPFTTMNKNVSSKKRKILAYRLFLINIQKGIWRHQTVYSFRWQQSVRYQVYICQG